MTTSDTGRGPVDPDFEGLFRAEEPAPPPAPVPEPIAEATSGPAPQATPDPVVESVLEPASAPAATDTGRLFRSQGAQTHPEAVLALASDHFGRLRTLRRDERTDAPAAGVEAEAEVESPAGPDAPAPPAAVTPDGDLPAGAVAPASPAAVVPVIAYEPGTPPVIGPDQEVATPERTARHRRRTITAIAGYLVVIGVTLIVGVANAALGGGALGWPTGLALLVSSVYVAWTIRDDDLVVAVIVPPLAYALTAATAGQAFLGASANSLFNRAVAWFFQLAGAWPWIIGSTVAALVVVLVRRYRGSARR